MQNPLELLPQKTKEVLIRPLVIRASIARGNPACFADEQAVLICERLGLQNDWLEPRPTRLEIHQVMARTLWYDEQIRELLKNWPDLVVVNLGAALDTRFYRVDNGRLRWYDIDLPDVIHLRKSVLPSDERKIQIGLSVFDEAWPARIDYEEPAQVVFLADHLFCYHTEANVVKLLSMIGQAFPGTVLYGDTVTDFAKRKSKQPYLFSLNRPTDLEALVPGLKVVLSLPAGVLYPEKQHLFVQWQNKISFFRNMNQLIKLRFEEAFP